MPRRGPPTTCMTSDAAALRRQPATLYPQINHPWRQSTPWHRPSLPPGAPQRCAALAPPGAAPPCCPPPPPSAACRYSVAAVQQAGGEEMVLGMEEAVARLLARRRWATARGSAAQLTNPAPRPPACDMCVASCARGTCCRRPPVPTSHSSSRAAWPAAARPAPPLPRGQGAPGRAAQRAADVPGRRVGEPGHGGAAAGGARDTQGAAPAGCHALLPARVSDVR